MLRLLPPWLAKFTNASYHLAESRAAFIERQISSIPDAQNEADNVRANDVSPRDGHCGYQHVQDDGFAGAIDADLQSGDGTASCAPGTQTRTAYSLEDFEFTLLVETMLERGISYGSLLPGFGFDGDLGECDHDRAPEVSSSTSFLAHLPRLRAALRAGLAISRSLDTRATLVECHWPGTRQTKPDRASVSASGAAWPSCANSIATSTAGGNTCRRATTRHDCPAAALPGTIALGTRSASPGMKRPRCTPRVCTRTCSNATERKAPIRLSPPWRCMRH